MSEDKRRQFRLSDPQLSVEKTEARGDKWVTSGQVTIAVTRGDDYSAGSFSFPFVDAESKDAAIEQASKQLCSVLDALTRYLEPSSEAA